MLHPGVDAFSMMEGQLRREARRYLDKLQRRIAARAGDITAIAHLAEAPSVTEAIARISRTADLVFMATLGLGWLGRAIFGSVGRDLLRARTRLDSRNHAKRRGTRLGLEATIVEP